MKLSNTALLSLLICTSLSPFGAQAACMTTGSDAYNPSSGDVVVCDDLTINNSSFSDGDVVETNFGNSNQSISINNSNISTAGQYSNLVDLDYFNNSSNIYIDNTTFTSAINVLSSDSSQSHAVNINNNANNNLVEISNTTIDLKSDWGSGLYLGGQSQNTVFDINNSVISTSTEQGWGVEIGPLYSQNITVNISDSTLNRSGPCCGGIVEFVYVDDSNLTIENTIMTSEDRANQGINLDRFNNGEARIINSSLLTNGTSSFAMNMLASVGSTIVIQDSNFTTQQSDGLRLFYNNQNNYITIDNSSISTPDYHSIELDGYTGTDSFGNVFIIKNGSNLNGLKALNGANIGDLEVTLDGSLSEVTLTGTSGTAIDFGEQDDSLTISGDVTINGTVQADGGNDTLNIINADYDVSNFLGFEDVNISGDSSVTGDITIGSGSTIAPGNSVGTVNITGNATFGTGSIYDAEYDRSGADLVAATGNVTIAAGATLSVTPINTQYSGGDLNIITAGGTVGGTFDTVTFSQSNFAQQVTYAANAVNIQYSTPSFISAQSKASAQTGLKYHDIISGQASTDKLDEENNLWVESIYSGQRSEYNSSSFYNSFNNNVYGMAFGSGKKYNDNIYIGYSVADLQSSMKMHNGDGEADSNSIYASIYGNYYSPINQKSNLVYTGAFTLGYESGDNDRAILTNSGVVKAKSDSRNLKIGGLLQLVVQNHIMDRFIATPKVGLSYLHIFADGYSESGAGNAGVAIKDHDYGVISPFASVEFKYPEALEVTQLFSITPKFEVGIKGEYITGNRNVNGSFTNSGTTFELPISKKASTFATVKTGFDFEVSNKVSGFVSLEHNFSQDDSSNSANIGFKIPLN